MLDIPTPFDVLNPELDHDLIDPILQEWGIIKKINLYHGEPLRWYYHDRGPTTKEIQLMNIKLNASGWNLKHTGHHLSAIGQWPMYELKPYRPKANLKYRILKILGRG